MIALSRPGPRRRSSLGARPFLLLAAAVLFGAVACATLLGDMHVSVSDVAHTLGNRLLGLDLAVDPIREGIIWHYRLARAAVAICAGATLAICGAVLQALLRNPLAEPYLLGISAGASTGAVTVIVLALGAGALSVSMGSDLCQPKDD